MVNFAASPVCVLYDDDFPLENYRFMHGDIMQKYCDLLIIIDLLTYFKV